ncbi:MAG: biopolymer transporter ExbD [Bacteroidota bacterium]|nr:biopolymer transporter ExbD [Bacteroidota bacterium]MEC8969251.1 biopolymer transporter ExbD [Bacteroidota bacterium]|tara:strand:- start:405 stop:797 length:393 start_codon:yes stop_codon:yes gene_type:complete
MGFKKSNSVKIDGGMSSMTDLVFLLLIFFIIISTMVNTSHEIDLPSSTGDPSLTSPVKVYITSDNTYFINSDLTPISKDNLESALLNLLGENKTIELLADKSTDREYAYNVVKIAKKNALKIVIKTKVAK